VIEGGLGLSANQIGEDKSVCVVDVTNPFFLLNPVITKKQKEIIYKEGCLSIPNKMITTKRYERIEVEADNVEGTMIFGPEKDNQVDNDLLLFESVCVQHEIDHLNGMTIHDRQVITTITNENNICRNDPCYCGSGKKLKKCCM